MQASIQGALKSQSSNNERAKRASAVRFADQVNLEDEMKLNATDEEEEVDQQESANGSNASLKRKEPEAKMKGRQLVGSVELLDDEGLAADEEDAGSRQKYREDEDDG